MYLHRVYPCDEAKLMYPIINRIDHEGLGPIKFTIPDCAYDVCSISHDAEDQCQQPCGFNFDSTQSDIYEVG